MGKCGIKVIFVEEKVVLEISEIILSNKTQDREWLINVLTKMSMREVGRP